MSPVTSYNTMYMQFLLSVCVCVCVCVAYTSIVYIIFVTPLHLGANIEISLRLF